jgi:hypothetical protein
MSTLQSSVKSLDCEKVHQRKNNKRNIDLNKEKNKILLLSAFKNT